MSEPRFVQSLSRTIAGIGASSADSEELRLRKRLLAGGSVMFIIAAFTWGLAYMAFGEWLASSIPMAYALISFISVLAFARTRQYAFFRFSQLALVLLLPFLLMIALGGFVNSSAVILWSLLCPLGALVFDEPRYAPRWFLAYAGLVILSAVIQPYVRTSVDLPLGLVILFFAMNIAVVSALAFTLLYSFVRQRDAALGLLRLEQKKSEGLLLNVLPREIADILKNEERVIADQFEQASILFADIVGFTPLTAQ
ncbi:MAG TPA: hypothetical protein VIU38_10415, partial [Anaerolineales bacterium]